jgi:hypothetical protein
MANYYGTARTNYFIVKDELTFKAWAKKRHCEVITSVTHPGMVGLLPNDDCEGTFMSYDSETDEDLDILDELSKHLKPGSVAILMEAGAEKMRYIAGHATAINHKGKTVFVSIDDIYKKAKKLGTSITECAY